MVLSSEWLFEDSRGDALAEGHADVRGLAMRQTCMTA
jgi:hypothetical protein